MINTFLVRSVLQILRSVQTLLHTCSIALTSWIKSMFKISSSGLPMELTIQGKTTSLIARTAWLNPLPRFMHVLALTSACCLNISSLSQLFITQMFLTGVLLCSTAWRSVQRPWWLLIPATTHQEQILNSLWRAYCVQSASVHSTLTHVSMRMMILLLVQQIHSSCSASCMK